jgi:signal transduction histidine kinase
MKISFKLSIWYFLVTLFILLTFSLAIYFGMQKLLYSTIDNEFDVLEDAIIGYYNPATKSFASLTSKRRKIDPFYEYYLIVYDNNRFPVYTSPIAAAVPLKISLSDTSAESGITKSSVIDQKIPYISARANEKITFRLVNRQIIDKGKRIGWFTAGVSIEKVEDSMAKLLRVIIFSDLAAVLLIAIGGFLLTRTSLRPIDFIIRRARHISSSNLNERIDITNEEDELGQLSKVLNNLLERLQKSFETQKSFLADAAHELKTPLSILRSHWEGEINNPELTLEMKEKLVHDIETITRLNHLINNLLLLSQNDLIQSGFEREKISLDGILNEVVSDVNVMAEIKDQSIDIVDLPQTDIKGDKNRLYQLFFNLLDNAVKYTQKNGKIWVSLRNTDGLARVEVRDNGPGIPQEDVSYIFDRFYRVEKDRNRRTGGSGLGLSICKLISELHNGKCVVESKEGEGSSFIVMLPVFAESKESK